MKVNANDEGHVEQLITEQCVPVIYSTTMLTLTLISCCNSLHADYSIAWGKSLGGVILTRALVVAMPSGKRVRLLPVI